MILGSRKGGNSLRAHRVRYPEITMDTTPPWHVVGIDDDGLDAVRPGQARIVGRIRFSCFSWYARPAEDRH